MSTGKADECVAQSIPLVAVALNKIKLTCDGETFDKQSRQRARFYFFGYRTHWKKSDAIINKNKILECFGAPQSNAHLEVGEFGAMCAQCILERCQRARPAFAKSD